MIIELLLFLLAIHIVRKYLRDSKFSHIPGPSPWLSLPLIGHGYLLGSKPIEAMGELQKKYGNVFRFDIGGDSPTIWLCTYDQMKEAFSKDTFNGRYWHDIAAIREAADKDHTGKPIHSVAVGTGPVWLEQKKFMTKSLAVQGIGNKDHMQDIMEIEAEKHIENLKKLSGQPISTKNHFFKVSNNVLWKFVTKKEERPDDEEKLKKVHEEMLLCVDGMCFTTLKSILQMNILFFMRLLQFFGISNFLDANRKVKSYLLEELDQSEPKEDGNYIEQALNERDNDIKDGKNSVFAGVDGKLYILAQLFDLLFGGTETTAGSMEWMMYYLARYPEYQEKMYEEICTLTGDNKRPIYLTDKPEAHLCNAFFDEVVRHSPFMSMIPGHQTLQDEEIDGFKLPKGTQVFCYSYGIFHDEKVFPDPLTFNPGRFLDENGIFCKDPRLVIFGVGRRRCPGELMARNENFLFTARIIQNFKVYLPKTEKKHNLMNVEPSGPSFVPVDANFYVEPRRKNN